MADMKSGEAIDSAEIHPEGEFPVFGGNGLRGYTGKSTHSLAASLVGRQGALCGNVNFADGDFYATEHAIVARPRDGVNARWLYWLLGSLDLNQYSMAAAQPGLAVEVIERVRAKRPGQREQERIANFLDEQTARIDALIAEKERLIATLVDARESEICQRLVPHLFRDEKEHLQMSGWLRSLPPSWQVKSLRRILVGGLANGIFKKRDEFGSGLLLVNVGDLYADDFQVDASKLDRVTISDEEYARFRVLEGDIFFVRSSLKEEGVAVSALAGVVTEPTVFECHVVRARPDRTQVEPRFLSFWLNSTICRQMLRCRANTTTMTTIDQDGILSVGVPLPPLSEQRTIVHEVERVFAHSDELTEIAHAMQDRLREYRSSLISAAVTGQLDISTYGTAT